jgi:hypothetical protein
MLRIGFFFSFSGGPYMCHFPLKQVSGGWVLDGQKRWIGNSTFADVLVVFARNSETNQING